MPFRDGPCMAPATAPGGVWLTDTSAGTDLYHPDRDGHEAYAVALDAAVRGVDPIEGDGSGALASTWTWSRTEGASA